MLAATPNNTAPGKYILYFLLGWTLLNVLQACTLGVHSDEAYYWIYSRFLDWGYYDHPPMVALFIRLGDSIMANEFGLRIVTIMASTLSVWFLWLIARRYQASARWFMLLVPGVFAFHIYGFTTTPDAPLLFFTIIFYYVYQQYLQKDSWATSVLLALVVTLLLYSKYHSILLLFFTLLANPKIFRRVSFWLIPVVATALYLPHILWQVHHNYPSASYHLFERSSETYEIRRTLEYIPGQLLMAGPLTGWFLFYYSFGIKIKDEFIRCLIFNGVGIFVFFGLNTIKGNVQPHWTLIGFVPLVLLTLIRLRASTRQPFWFLRLAMVNAALIVAFRLLLITGVPAIKNMAPLKTYFHYNEWAQQIKQKAGNAYVIMPVGFQSASKYNYYTHSLKGFAYDGADYRRTQYDIWPIEDSMQHKRAFYTTPYFQQGFTDSVKTVSGTWYGRWVNHVRTYQKIDIKTDDYTITVNKGQQVTFNLQLVNPYSRQVSFNTTGPDDDVDLLACFYQGDLVQMQNAGNAFNQISIPPHQKAAYTFKVTAPLKAGRYELIFSIRTTPFPGGRNSRIVNFTVQ